MSTNTIPTKYIDLSNDSIRELFEIAVSGKKTRVVEHFDKDGNLTSSSKIVETTPKLAAQSLMMADVVLEGKLGVNEMVQAIHGKSVNHLSRPKRLAVDVVEDVVSNKQSHVSGPEGPVSGENK